MKEIGVSIIVPIYNVERYILRCLDSISNQNYRGQIQCLLINDCSTDSSLEISKNYVKSYAGHINFTIISHSSNKGLSEARNTGIKNSSCDYIFFLDSDDAISPDCISSLIDTAKRNSYPNMVVGNTKLIGFSHNWLKLDKNLLDDFSNDEKWIKRMMLSRCFIPVTATNKLYLNSWLKSNVFLFEPSILHEDELWNYILANNIKSIAFCYKFTYNYYFNNSSITASCVNNPKKIKSLIRIIHLMLNNLCQPCKKYQIKCILQLYNTMIHISGKRDISLENKIAYDSGYYFLVKPYILLYLLFHK